MLSAVAVVDAQPMRTAALPKARKVHARRSRLAACGWRVDVEQMEDLDPAQVMGERLELARAVADAMLRILEASPVATADIAAVRIHGQVSADQPMCPTSASTPSHTVGSLKRWFDGWPFPNA